MRSFIRRSMKMLLSVLFLDYFPIRRWVKLLIIVHWYNFFFKLHNIRISIYFDIFKFAQIFHSNQSFDLPSNIEVHVKLSNFKNLDR